MNYIKKITLLIVILVMVSFISVQTLIISNSRTDINNTADVIIVLGAKVIEDKPSLSLAERLDITVDYAKDKTELPIVVSGGQGDDEIMSEADAMKAYLIDKGIDEKRIYTESESRSTLENLKYSAKIIYKKLGIKNPKVIIVSNGFHLYRAKYLAQKLGLKAQGLAARTPIITIPKSYSREYLAIMYTYVFYREASLYQISYDN